MPWFHAPALRPAPAAIAAGPGASLFQAISEGNPNAVAGLLSKGRIDLGTLHPTTGHALVMPAFDIATDWLHETLAQQLPQRAASSIHPT